MKTLLTVFCLPLLALGADPTGIYSGSKVREQSIRGTDDPLDQMESAAQKAADMNVPFFVWVNMDPKNNAALYDQLKGVHLQVPALFRDNTPRIGIGKGGNYLFIKAAKLGPDSAQKLMEEWNSPSSVPMTRTVMPIAPPLKNVLAYAPPSGGGGQKAFRSGNYNPTHTCPNCGSEQYVIAGWNGDGTHNHTCSNCGTTWKH